VHVLAARERDFMPIAAEIRKALHDQGIHSCTIQPEYYGARVAMEVRAFRPPSIPSISLHRNTQWLIDLREQVPRALPAGGV
jgi:hypothetical protein